MVFLKEVGAIDYFKNSKGDKMKNIKGFTLIELLIVVIIIAILAALFLPRFLSQPERAYIAEAQQQLGALRRAQIANMDATGATSYSVVTSNTGWGTLGLLAPSSTNFTYACDNTSGGRCLAYRTGMSNSSITLSADGIYTCAGVYEAVGGGTSSPKGCTYTG